MIVADPSAKRLERWLGALVGTPLWGAWRNADMAIFHFGRRRHTVDHFGHDVEVGDIAIHAECAWRLVFEGATAVGWRDLYYGAGIGPAREASEEEIEGRRTRLDERIRTILHAGEDRVVASATLRSGYALELKLAGGASLEIMPSDSTEKEQWRIFAPGDLDSQVVVLGTGLEPPEAEP